MQGTNDPDQIDSGDAPNLLAVTPLGRPRGDHRERNDLGALDRLVGVPRRQLARHAVNVAYLAG